MSLGLILWIVMQNFAVIQSAILEKFIIFLTSIYCDGSNRLWRQHLLPSPCSLWRHKQTVVGVIRPLASGKCQTFPWVTERYRFHRYLCFHCLFSFRGFCILFCTNRVTISYLNCIHSNSTLTVRFSSGNNSCWFLTCFSFPGHPFRWFMVYLGLDVSILWDIVVLCIQHVCLFAWTMCVP